MNGNCDRCKKESNITTCSFFNIDMICPTCETEEQNHSHYKKAKEKELKEVLKGNLNYGGIGLPKDLIK